MTIVDNLKARGMIPKAVLYARFSSDNQREESIEAQLRAMEKSLKDQEVLTQHYSRQEYVTMNHVFHWLVVEASANKYYEKYLNELYNKINTYMIFYDQSSDNNSIVSHTMIYEALRDRDLEKGLAGIREDIQIAWEDMRKINVPL